MAEAKESKNSDARTSETAEVATKSPEPGAPAAAGASATRFAEFLQSRKLDARRILVASRKLEALHPEDRAIKLAKRRARASEAGDGSVKETRKPRSGRPVTDRAIQAAVKGGQLSGPTKTRILRAVNHLLGQKKQDPIDLRSLF